MCVVTQSCLIPWTVAHQPPLCMEFSRQKYWSGLPYPCPGDLPHAGIRPGSSVLWADSLLSEPPALPQSQSSTHIQAKTPFPFSTQVYIESRFSVTSCMKVRLHGPWRRTRDNVRAESRLSAVATEKNRACQWRDCCAPKLGLQGQSGDSCSIRCQLPRLSHRQVDQPNSQEEKQLSSEAL